METIPVINCKDYSCVKERIDILSDIGSEWIKFDISDGKFNPVVSWNDPEQLSIDYKSFLDSVSVEVHCMIQEPKEDIVKWLEAGADRIIVHVESDFDLEDILSLCEKYDAELMVAKNPDTSLDKFDRFFDKVRHFQFLAVKPGYSGQAMKDSVLEEIKALRQLKPDVKIEVDGGIDEKTTKKVKEAGADIVVSSSYIFKSDNPGEAFKELKLI